MNQFARNLRHSQFNEDWQLKDECTAADLLLLAFFDGRVSQCDVFTQAAMTVADDISIIISAIDTGNEPDTETIVRILMRARDRLAIGLSLRDRIAKAEQGGKGELYVIPNGDFGARRVATPEDLAADGWVRRENVSKTVGILLGEKTEIENPKPEAES